MRIVIRLFILGTVIGVCLVMLIVYLETSTNGTGKRKIKTLNMMSGIISAVEGYVIDHDEAPPLGRESFLAALQGENPKEVSYLYDWGGRYRVGEDAWGNPMRFLRTDTSLLVWSAGPDGHFQGTGLNQATGDDLVIFHEISRLKDLLPYLEKAASEGI